MLFNQGRIDRLVRVIAGIAVLSLFFFGHHSVWALIGLVPLVTGIIGWCPLYQVFGMNTCTAPSIPRKT